MSPGRLSYASVVLDVDSTLSSLEGIDWLAERCGREVTRAVAAMTDRAMRGEVPLEAVYGERLALVRPAVADVQALAQAYLRHMVPGVQQAVRALHRAGIRVAIVSGGLRDAILPLGALLDIAAFDVHAVSLTFAVDGTYTGYDVSSPLAQRGGKSVVVRQLELPRAVLGVGDGQTDAELRMDSGAGPAIDTFAAFIGVVARPSVVALADHVVRHFEDLPALVLPFFLEQA